MMKEQKDTITNNDIYDAFERGRQLMQGCELRPETPEDRSNQYLYCNATSGTLQERAVKMWFRIANLGK